MTRKLILLCLADAADDKGVAYPSAATIAKRCGMSKTSVKTVRRELDELRDAGLITWRGRVRKGTSEQTSHEYTVLYRGVGAENPHVVVDDPDVGADDPTNQPPNQPLNQSPTPAPSSVDEAESSLRSPSLSERRPDRHLLELVRDIARAETDDGQEAAAALFIEELEISTGEDIGYWDYGWSSKLGSLVKKHGLDYGTAKWLGIFTNSVKAL